MSYVMKELVYVGLGGIAGTLTRYGVQLWMPQANGGFPWGVLLINAVGSLFLGWFFTVAVPHKISAELRLAIGTGFTGAFTTFSTFALDMVRLAEGGHWISAAAYVFTSIAAGLLLCSVGIRWGEQMLKRDGRGGAQA